MSIDCFVTYYCICIIIVRFLHLDILLAFISLAIIISKINQVIIL